MTKESRATVVTSDVTSDVTRKGASDCDALKNKMACCLIHRCLISSALWSHLQLM